MADRTSNVRVNVRMDSSGGISGALGFGKAVGVAALGVGALAVGVGIGANKLYDYADAADDANARIANTVKQMGLFGKATADVTARIEEQARQTSLNTAVDLNSIKATQAKLLTFKELAKTADEAGGNFDRATQAAVDMAALGFGTAETNAVQLGKALNDPIKGLTSLNRSGITFTETEKARIQTLVESNRMGEAQAFILKAIETQVGGTAAATAGGFELMKNRLSIFGQELAMKALPYMDAFGTFMIEKGGPAILEFARGVQETATQLGERMAPTVAKVSAFIMEKAVPALQEFAGWVQDHVVPAIVEYVTPALEGAKEGFDKIAAAVKRNQPELEEMGNKLKKIAEYILDKVVPVFGDLAGDNLKTLGAAIGGAIDTLVLMYNAWSNLFRIIGDVIGRIQQAIDKLHEFQNAQNAGTGIKPPGSASTTSTGGTQTQPGAPRVTININGTVADPQGTANALERLIRRNGTRLGAAVA